MTKAFHMQIDVAYRDMDPAGHVSSTVYYIYMLNAYMAYAHQLLDVPLENAIPQIMVKTSCEYIRPAKWGDILDVEARVTRFGTKSLDIEYLISRISGERAILAKGASTHVGFNYMTDHTVPLSDEFKRRVLAYQGRSSSEIAPLATSAAMAPVRCPS